MISRIALPAWNQCLYDCWIEQPFVQFGRPGCVVDDGLDIVRYEDLPQVVHLQNVLGRIVGDGVTLKNVFLGSHLPGKPTLAESRVHAEHVG